MVLFEHFRFFFVLCAFFWFYFMFCSGSPLESYTLGNFHVKLHKKKRRPRTIQKGKIYLLALWGLIILIFLFLHILRKYFSSTNRNVFSFFLWYKNTSIQVTFPHCIRYDLSFLCYLIENKIHTHEWEVIAKFSFWQFSVLWFKKFNMLIVLSGNTPENNSVCMLIQKLLSLLFNYY